MHIITFCLIKIIFSGSFRQYSVLQVYQISSGLDNISSCQCRCIKVCIDEQALNGEVKICEKMNFQFSNSGENWLMRWAKWFLINYFFKPFACDKMFIKLNCEHPPYSISIWFHCYVFPSGELQIRYNNGKASLVFYFISAYIPFDLDIELTKIISNAKTE